MENKIPSEVSTSLSLSCCFDSQTSNDRSKPSNSKKRVCHKIPQERKGDCTTTLNHFTDPWKIRKTLRQSDVGESSRLLVATNLVEGTVLPMMGVDAKDRILTNEGILVEFWDMDTKSLHKLILKRWSSSKSYVFIGGWYQDFVKRRNLKKGDEIGLHWDSNKCRFDFSVRFRDFFQSS